LRSAFPFSLAASHAAAGAGALLAALLAERSSRNALTCAPKECYLGPEIRKIVSMGYKKENNFSCVVISCKGSFLGPRNSFWRPESRGGP
jgi:hypothetical protein